MVESSLYWMFMANNKLAMDECDKKKTRHLKDYKEAEEKLLKTLNKEQTKLFKSFRYDFLYHILTIRDRECSNIIFDSIKIGMEFQKYLCYKDEERGTPISED